MHGTTNELDLESSNMNQMATKPVQLNGKLIKCLLYADDLVLFSTTAQGLQHQLNNLHTYCCMNELKVNTDKTEWMRIKAFHLNQDANTEALALHYNGKNIKQVVNFKYVGMMTSSDGDAAAHHKMTQTKATKAMYTCMARSLKLGTNCPLYTKALLYKAYVTPIATYGIETNIYSDMDRAAIDRTNLHYCRWAMGVN